MRGKTETHKLARSWKISLSADERTQIPEDESTQDLIHENNGNLIPLLQKIPGCEKAEDCWMNYGKHALTDGNITVMVNGAKVEDYGQSDAAPELQKEEK